MWFTSEVHRPGMRCGALCLLLLAISRPPSPSVQDRASGGLIAAGDWVGPMGAHHDERCLAGITTSARQRSSVWRGGLLRRCSTPGVCRLRGGASPERTSPGDAPSAGLSALAAATLRSLPHPELNALCQATGVEAAQSSPDQMVNLLLQGCPTFLACERTSG